MKRLRECPHVMGRHEVQVAGEADERGAADEQNGLESCGHGGQRSDARLNGS